MAAVGRTSLWSTCPRRHVAGGVLQSCTVTRFPGGAVPRVGGRLTLSSLSFPQRLRGARGARGVPVQGAAGQAVVCAAAAAQSRLGTRVPGVPRRRRSVCGLRAQVGGAEPEGEGWVEAGPGCGGEGPVEGRP